MKSILYILLAFAFVFSGSASSTEVTNKYYIGSIQVLDTVASAKATYKKFDTTPDPYIKITYKISGKDYVSSYIKSFGDKLINKPNAIIVYNDSKDKKQNYYFQGEEVSALKFSLH